MHVYVYIYIYVVICLKTIGCSMIGVASWSPLSSTSDIISDPPAKFSWRQTEQVQDKGLRGFERGIGFEGRWLGVKIKSNNIKNTQTWVTEMKIGVSNYTSHAEPNDLAKWSTLQGNSALFRCLVQARWWKYDRYEFYRYEPLTTITTRLSTL